ncbi:class I SAM-dependent methyltransferase [Kitasatospora sp. NPDC051853]|uniref:class I SAM-dependent methyltransferase n=1 Tax=Kitasatospora sp. NPDC051853 TaxID=3364058 RepID=UPI0037A48C1C
MDATSPVARFYDRLAADYHLIYGDWESALARQGAALDAVIRSALGPSPATVLDCACGIGTQALGLALRGHRVTGTDLSPVAAERAAREAARRGLTVPTRAADMRELPFDDGSFDVVVCADNALPHLLTAADVRTALSEMRRVLRAGGLLLVSTRPYDEIRRSHPVSTAPQLHGSGSERTVTFQLWEWHEDGERYDLEHFQLHPEGSGWTTKARRTTYWALTRAQLTDLATESGLESPTWLAPEDSAFFQPLLTARAPRP